MRHAKEETKQGSATSPIAGPQADRHREACQPWVSTKWVFKAGSKHGSASVHGGFTAVHLASAGKSATSSLSSASPMQSSRTWALCSCSHHRVMRHLRLGHKGLGSQVFRRGRPYQLVRFRVCVTSNKLNTSFLAISWFRTPCSQITNETRDLAIQSEPELLASAVCAAPPLAEALGFTATDPRKRAVQSGAFQSGQEPGAYNNHQAFQDRRVGTEPAQCLLELSDCLAQTRLGGWSASLTRRTGKEPAWPPGSCAGSQKIATRLGCAPTQGCRRLFAYFRRSGTCLLPRWATLASR